MSDIMRLSDIGRRGELISLYTEQVEAKGLSDNLIPLHVAAKKGDIETLAIRLNEGSDVDINQKFTGNGMEITALHSAVLVRQKEAIVFLLEYGADPYIDCLVGIRRKFSAPLLAAEQGAFDLLDLFDLSGHIDDVTPFGRKSLFHYAAKYGNVEYINKCLAAGVNIDVVDYEGWSPLFYAIQGGHKEVVDFLIEKGANPLLESGDDTAFTLAMSNVHKHNKFFLMEKLLPYLIETSNWSVKPLFCAVANEDEEVFKWLHQKGAKLDVVNEDDETLLERIQTKKEWLDGDPLQKIQNIETYIKTMSNIS